MIGDWRTIDVKSSIVHILSALLLLAAGCTDAPQQPDQSQPPAAEQPSSEWVDSEDGVLSLRLGTPDTTVDCKDPITVVVELRNNSDEPVNVLRPFGDLNAVASWFDLTGPKGAIGYTDGMPSYPLGRNGFAELTPGKSICGWQDLIVECFDGSDLSGQYTVRYKYAVGRGHRESAERMGVENVWTGEITSRAVTVMKEESAGNKIEDVVSIQFLKDEYVFTIEEVAKGVRFVYRIMVRNDLDGVIPRPQQRGSRPAPGPSGLYPFEEVSGKGQSYSIADTGLGPPNSSPRRIEEGTYLHSFSWDGKNWSGLSDTNNPKGPPFPPGTYTLRVRLRGEVQMPDGPKQYDFSCSASVRLVP
jgi:hypothetical protein